MTLTLSIYVRRTIHFPIYLSGNMWYTVSNQTKGVVL